MGAYLPRKNRVVVSNSRTYVHLNYDSQLPPYDRPLFMSNRYHFSKRLLGAPNGNQLPANTSFTEEGSASYFRGNMIREATNRAYSNLVKGLGDNASFGATLTAERRETFGMLTSLVIRAYSAAKAVKRLDLASAARSLGLPYSERNVVKRFYTRTRKGKKRVVRVRRTYFEFGTGREFLKTAASGWLMWSYGIKPLMSDIYAAVDALQSDFPWKRISGSGRVKRSETDYKFVSPDIYTLRLYEGSVSVRQSAEFRINNPNLALANKLGLINPAQMALEAIPFSFVIDWFSNLSDVVMSFTDFSGYSLRNACLNRSSSFKFDWTGANPWNPVDNRVYRDVLTSEFRTRTLGLTPPRLLFAYERFNWQRAANAISLLVGFLPRTTKR